MLELQQRFGGDQDADVMLAQKIQDEWNELDYKHDKYNVAKEWYKLAMKLDFDEDFAMAQRLQDEWNQDEKSQEKSQAAIRPSSKAEKTKEEDPQCSICLESLKNGAGVEMLACGHAFHRKHISEWFKHDPSGKNLCPVCKKPAKQRSGFVKDEHFTVKRQKKSSMQFGHQSIVRYH